MGDKSKIEWTESTWNPITGCTPVSEGCANCYAKREAEGRLRGKFGYPQDEPFRVTFHGEDRLNDPLRWKRPRKIFVCSMGDLFHEDVPVEWIDKVIDAVARCEQHRFMLLTKRPERMKSYFLALRDDPEQAMRFRSGRTELHKYALALRRGEPLRNVWLGVTAENQQRADERIPLLLQIPAAKHFVSVEPMLGPVNFVDVPVGMLGPLRPIRKGLPADIPRIDWVICGGETGPEARPMHRKWVRSLRDQCVAAKVPFFFKSWGEWKFSYEVIIPEYDKADGLEYWRRPGEKPMVAFPDGTTLERLGRRRTGRELDGRTWDEEPEENP